MWTLTKKLLNAFIYDEMAAKRWIRGGLNFSATIAAQLVIDPAWSTWTFKQWAVHAVPAVVAFAAGSVTAGEKNKPDAPQ